jgi:hypothetical protein
MVLVPRRNEGMKERADSQNKQTGSAIEATRNGAPPLLFGQFKVLQ